MLNLKSQKLCELTDVDNYLSLTFKKAVAGAALVLFAGSGAIPFDTYASEPPLEPGNPQGHNISEPDSHSHAWDYGATNGPDHWDEISPLCGYGHQQSPVDLRATTRAALPPLEIDYKPAPLTIVNNGHTIQVSYPEGSKLTVGGESFNLVQFHFHAPSEYTIDGKRYDMEAHFVHKNDKGDLAVIGVLIEEGAENKFAADIWSRLPATAGEAETHPDVIVEAADLIPKKTKHYQLTGSLTTPPCSEGVAWYVMETPIQFSSGQIQAFKKLFPNNARPLQKRNQRPIVLGY